MRDVAAIYHRTGEVNIYRSRGRFLIEAFLQDEVHDVHAEVEILHPSLEIVAARSEVRNGPFTVVCNMTHPNVERLIGMRVTRGFTGEAREDRRRSEAVIASELLVEIAQAAYQLHFVRLFQSVPIEERTRGDNPVKRHAFVLDNIPGMRDTCFSYSESRTPLIAEQAEPLQLRSQTMPVRKIDVDRIVVTRVARGPDSTAAISADSAARQSCVA
jgi:hypothetical protein